jgi:hypothetical protein
MSIRLGSIVEISLDPSPAKAPSLKARVYDVVGKRFVLSQTSPPLRASALEKPLYISYIAKDSPCPRRLGFPAKLTGLAKDYALSSGVSVPAVVVEMKGEPTQISLRKGYRVHPPRSSGITLAIGGRPCEIVDISLAGLRFVQGSYLHAFDPGDHLECLIAVDGRPYPVEARVVRTAQVSLARHIAVAFQSVSGDLQTVLSKKILLLERKQLCRGF